MSNLLLYRYPQAAFPYQQLVDVNQQRNRQQPEFELHDTGVFDNDAYFDVFIEYAKAGPADVLIRISAYNRGAHAAHVLVSQHLALGLRRHSPVAPYRRHSARN